MTTFYTADTHIAHANIIQYCSRPFSTVDEMDLYILKKWNERVKPTDTVWHLGDVFFRCHELLAALKGQKILILGNHDQKNITVLSKFFKIHPKDIVVDKGNKIVMSHYPLLEWPHKFQGWKHLHGHSHGTQPPRENVKDVGVDCWDFTPMTLEELFP